MAAMESPVRDAAPRCSAFAMPPMKLTTAPTARREESCWQTGPLAAFCVKTGHALLKNWKNGWAVELQNFQFSIRKTSWSRPEQLLSAFYVQPNPEMV